MHHKGKIIFFQKTAKSVREVFTIKHKHSIQTHRTITIGICGSSHRTGVTTVALAFSTFLSSGTHKWVGCVELNNSGAFSAIGGLSNPASFRKCGIDFFPAATLSAMDRLQHEKYDVLVIDFGVLTRHTFSAFRQCDLCLVLGYVNPWNSQIYRNWVDHVFHSNDYNQSEIILLGNLSNLGDIRHFQHDYGLRAIAVPFVENPFQLSSGNWKFIERTLERNQYTTKLLFSGR